MSGTQFDVFFVSKCTHSPFTICSLSRSFTKDLGQLVRAHRKGKGLTLERVSGLGNLSIRFLSEFERGKETAEIGKILKALRTLGLDIIVQPRGGATPFSHGPYPTKTRSDKS